MCVRTHWLGIFGQHACYRWHSNALNCGYFVWVDAHTIGCNRSPILLPSLCIYCLWLNGMWKSSLFFFVFSFVLLLYESHAYEDWHSSRVNRGEWLSVLYMHACALSLYVCVCARLFVQVRLRTVQSKQSAYRFYGLVVAEGCVKISRAHTLCNGKYENDLISIDSITNSIMSHEKWKKQWQYSKMQQISMCVILFF